MKQILLDFSYGDGKTSKDSDSPSTNANSESRTRIMIVTSSTLLNESSLEDINNVQGFVDMILTQDKNIALKSNSKTSDKNESVKKHFILTLHPTAANYKATLDTLVLASRLDNVCGLIGRNDRIHLIKMHQDNLNFIRCIKRWNAIRPYGSEI